MVPQPLSSPTRDGVEDDNDEPMDGHSDVEDETLLEEHMKDETQLEDGATVEETNYSVFSNPPSLSTMRQRLFEVERTIELSHADFNTYFPFVDNIWRKLRNGETQADGSTTVEFYCCRLKRGANHKSQNPKAPQEGKQQRRKRTREEKTCDMTIKVVHKYGSEPMVVVTRGTGIEDKHTHDLDYMDSTKRNSAVMDVARREAVKGFLPTSVFWKMETEPDQMEAAGGKFMKISDVRNVQYAWRQENQTIVLKAHSGYNSAKVGPKGVFHKRLPAAGAKLKPDQVPMQPAHAIPAYETPIPSTQGPPPPHPLPSRTLQYPDHAREFLQPYLPNRSAVAAKNRPHVTLTWASSLDGRIAIMPGVQTVISGPETKAMTHYLRSQHDAILVGVRTAIADDPALNCRLAGVGGYGGYGLNYQPRPIIIDPYARLHIRPEMNVLKIADEGKGKAPWVIVSPAAQLHPTAVGILKGHGGEFLMINDYNAQTGGFNWEGVFDVLFREGLQSVMIEGGAVVLSELLKPRYSRLIDTVILTIAPTFFGQTGLPVSQGPTYDDRGKPIATRLNDVRWQPMGDADVVMCGRMKPEQPSNGILPGIEEFTQAPAGSRPPT